MRKIIVLFLLFFSVTCLWAQNDEKQAAEKANIVKVGQVVPNFSFAGASGEKIPFSKYKGKVSVIVFFATWCGPCRMELPHIEKEIWNKYRDNKNFALFIFGREHSQVEVDRFKNDNHYSMPFYADPKRGVYSKFAKNYIPRIYLVNSNGKVTFATMGYDEAGFHKLQDLLQIMLKK